MKRPTLIVVCGPNGSGKTTITRKILKHEWLDSATYINPDEIANTIFGDWNSPEAIINAANYAKKQRYRLLEERQSIIFETVSKFHNPKKAIEPRQVPFQPVECQLKYV